MKIGITGHTQGLGKSLYDIFNSQKHNTLGFSRSNGFDIGNELDRKKIVNKIKDIDIFINNAYDPQGQLDILKEVLSCWSNTEKIVINVSSIIVHKESTYFEGEIALYRESKIKLNNMIKNYKGSVKILNIIPGLMNTNFDIIPIDFDRSNSIDTEALAELIYVMIKNHNNFFIKEIIVDNNGTFKSKI